MASDRNSLSWNWSWGGIVLVVLVILAAIQLVRVNPPDDRTNGREEKNILWTNGTLISGTIEVEAGGHLTYPINLNKRVTLNGFFTTGDSSKRLACSIIAASDLNAWRAGKTVPILNTTGPVPRGLIKRVLEPGYYTLIIDNRTNNVMIQMVESHFEVK